MADGQASVDLVIEKRGIPIVAVEARNVDSPSAEWAAQFVRNIFAYGEPTGAQYFLLALRNHLYVWRDPKAPVFLPDFEGDTVAALEPYLTRLRRPLEKVSQSGFEMLIQAWLGELVLGILPDSGDQKWLVESGFAEAVRDADIRTKIAA